MIHVLKMDTMVNIHRDVIHWWYVCRETVTVFGSHAGIENRKLLGACKRRDMGEYHGRMVKRTRSNRGPRDFSHHGQKPRTKFFDHGSV